MELNREAIIKALECCTYGGDKTKSQVEVCSLCPYFNEGNCTDVLKESALALIKELTEENEKLTKRLEKEAKCQYDLCGQIVDLKADNERLMREKTALECVVSTARNQAKADTVRKMQSELKKTFSALCKGEMGDFYRIIDQIAKEILEGA